MSILCLWSTFFKSFVVCIQGAVVAIVFSLSITFASRYMCILWLSCIRCILLFFIVRCIYVNIYRVCPTVSEPTYWVKDPLSYLFLMKIVYTPPVLFTLIFVTFRKKWSPHFGLPPGILLPFT